jgi:anti-sigma regulatory factor (Ser/Thr protein kinase)
VPAFEAEIAARPTEVSRVRRAVRAAVVRYGLGGEHADIAQLLASELVMNAVLHGVEPIVVRVSVERDATVLEVYDAGNPLPTTVPSRDPGRRGLRVVASLCADWGAVPADGGGKTVWCTIPHETADRPRDPAPRRRSDDRPA